MFRSLANLFAATTGRQRNDVFIVHPLQLSRWLDEAWSVQATVPSFDPNGEGKPPFLGSDDIVEILDLPDPFPADGQAPVPSGLATNDPDRFNNEVFEFATPPLVADHLAYAWLIESTGVFEIMAEVVRRLVVGETLDSPVGGRDPLAAGDRGAVLPGPAALLDLRASQRGATPDRGDPAATRTGGCSAWSCRTRSRRATRDLTPTAPSRGGRTRAGVNTDFREKWTELLRQVWLGIENARTTASAPTPPTREYVAFLCRGPARHARRCGAAAGCWPARSSCYVATMSWFHLTLESRHPDRGRPQGPGAPVRPTAWPRSPSAGRDGAGRRGPVSCSSWPTSCPRSCGPSSSASSTPASRPRPCSSDSVPTTSSCSDMNRIIDLWQSATGERVKDRPVGSVVRGSGTSRPDSAGTSSQPVRLPTPAPSPTSVTAGNGAHP